jgi:hypothetical protein
LVVSAYCDFRDQHSTSVNNIIGSLVAQLCEKIGVIPSQLSDAYDSSNSGGQRAQVKLNKLLDVLVEVSTLRSVTVMVDGLDECTDVEEAAGGLARLVDQQCNIRILVTSRNLSEIEAFLGQARRIRLEQHKDHQQADISTYSHARLHADRGLSRLSPSIQTEITTGITSKADGMFRWAQCQLDTMASLRTPRAIRSSLQTLPLGLDETYTRILRAVPASDVEFVRKILLCTSFSIRPMKITEIHEAIAIESETGEVDDENRLSSPDDVLALCRSLVTVSGGSTLRISHLSVRDFLLSDTVQNDPSIAAFFLTPIASHTQMAQDCLTYLCFDDMTQGPSRSRNAYAQRVARFPLLRYAAIYWPYHVKRSRGGSEALHDLALRFLLDRNRFMAWVQVLNARHVDGWNGYPKNATPLYYAASFGLLRTVRALIEHPRGINLDARAGRFGGTALHAAVFREHPRVAQLLLQAGADANIPDNNGHYALHLATFSHYQNMIDLLLRHGAASTARDERGETPAGWARRAKTHASHPTGPPQIDKHELYHTESFLALNDPASDAS